MKNYHTKFKTLDGAGEYILERVRLRDEFYARLLRLCFVCIERGIRLIVENPYTTNSFLKGNFIAPPAIVDEDRTRRGDYFAKPTAYWFFNCEPTHGYTQQQTPANEQKHFWMHGKAKYARESYAKGSDRTGICSEERSLMHPNYARNFICDFVLGQSQPSIDLQLF